MVDKTRRKTWTDVLRNLRNFVPSIASETRIQSDADLLRNINIPHSSSSACALNPVNTDVP